MICGIIDLGSNTIRLSIYQHENGQTKLLLSKKSIAGLLGYAESGVLSQKGMYKACSVLNNFKDILENFGIKEAYVFATASLRNISNTEEVTELIKTSTGFDIDLLSGEEEAQLDFYGATKTAEAESGLLVDIGGGSTELVAFEHKEIVTATSIPLGSLNLSLKHVTSVMPKKSGIKKIKQEINREIKKTQLLNQYDYETVYGVGGSVRAARKLYNDIYKLPDDNMIMESEKFSEILQKYNDERRDVVHRIMQLSPDRIHTIITGMIILNSILVKSRCLTIHVSTMGVREGYLFNKVLDGEAEC